MRLLLKYIKNRKMCKRPRSYFNFIQPNSKFIVERTRHMSWTMKYRVSIGGTTFRKRVPRPIIRTLRYNAKKKVRKKERETGNCSRNPFTAFQLASRITETFPVERFHEKGKSGESAKQESKNGEGLKMGALCRALFVCTIAERKD